METSLTGITGLVMREALYTASLRQAVGAANIANASRPGFTPMRVSFEHELQRALQTYHASGSFDLPKAAVETAPIADGSLAAVSVRVDEEAARLVTNAVHYQALIAGLRGYTEIIASAVSDGKR